MRNIRRARVGMTLDVALGQLCEALGGSHVIVVDQSEYGWGSHHPGVHVDRVREDAVRFYLTNVAPRRVALKRGKKLYVCQTEFIDRQVGDTIVTTAPHLGQSFANIYVLIVWFDAPFEEIVARALVEGALPRIESLTLATPPPDGPHVTSGAARKRG